MGPIEIEATDQIVRWVYQNWRKDKEAAFIGVLVILWTAFQIGVLIWALCAAYEVWKFSQIVESL